MVFAAVAVVDAFSKVGEAEAFLFSVVFGDLDVGVGSDVFEGLVDGVVVGVSRGFELNGLVFVGDGDEGAFVVALFIVVVWFLMILLFVFAFQEFVDERREGSERYVAQCSSFYVFEV